MLSKLVTARKEAGLTQRDVSVRMGMSHSFLNKCESGERIIDIVELWELARIYGKALSHFAPDEL